MDKLQDARAEISRIDEEMAALFSRRMAAVRRVAEYKKERGLPILDAAREKELLEKNSLRVEEDELRPFYALFLKDTMAVSRAYQQRLLEGMRVAYSGTEGAFAHIAAGRIFPSASRVGFSGFAAAYRAAETGDCDCAVLPLENSTAGEVGQVTDLMFDGSLFVNGVYELPVRHDLVALPETGIDEIESVISHPQALEQCSEYLRKKGWAQVPYANTAMAAKQVAEAGSRRIAAIASEETAALYGLRVLEPHINKGDRNTTRFGVFSRTAFTGLGQRMGDHFILLFTTRNQAGALAQAIDIIGRYGFNMRTLRSRPRQDLMWEYYFYAEVEGDVRSPKGEAMLRELSACCDTVRVAGSFQAHRSLTGALK